jgi:hypothetical protein
VLAVGTEPDGAGVRDDLLLVDPVADAVENGARNACEKYANI